MRYSRDLRARQPGGRRTLTQQLLSALGRYPGSSLFVHGAGVVRGIQAGNWLFSNATTAATVDNPVGRIDDVRGGVPALQDTTQKKVTLRRGLVNQLLQSRDYATTWNAVASGATVASNVDIAPDGTTTADALVEVSGVTYGFNQATSASGAATFAVIAKAGAKQFVYLQPNAGGAYFNLATGAIGHVGINCTGASIAEIINGWYLCVINFAAASTATPVQIYASKAGGINSAGYTGVAGVRAIYLSDSAVFSGTLTAQQIIDAGGIPITTTAPASSATGPWAHQFDGADDSFGTTLTPGNAGFVCVGANFYDNNLRTVLGAGAGATTGDAGVWLSRNAGNLTLYTSDGASRQSVSAAYPIGTNAVASAGWSSDSMLVGANGTEATAAKTLNCATASKQMAIGMMTAAGSTAGMLGTLGGAMIIVPALPTPADRALMRKWVGNLYRVPHDQLI